MKNPIIDHYGAYVTRGRHLTPYFEIYGGLVCQFEFHDDMSFNPEEKRYATREAAEMALIRAKCLRRLKEMAYGGGWLPTPHKFDDAPTYTVESTGAYIWYIEGVRFKDCIVRDKAEETITSEERAAFLYVCNPNGSENDGI